MNRSNYPLSLTLAIALLALFGLEDALSTIVQLSRGKPYFEVGALALILVPGLLNLRPTARIWTLGFLSVYIIALAISGALKAAANPATVHVLGLTVEAPSQIAIGVTATRIALMAWQIYVLMRSDVRRWFNKPEGICRACGYNLQAIVSEKCPECGYVPEVFSYPCTIHDDPTGFTVTIPDLPGVTVKSISAEGAVGSAKAAANKHVRELLKRGEHVPPPRPMTFYMSNQDSAGVLWAAVEVDMATMRLHL